MKSGTVLVMVSFLPLTSAC